MGEYIFTLHSNIAELAFKTGANGMDSMKGCLVLLDLTMATPVLPAYVRITALKPIIFLK